MFIDKDYAFSAENILEANTVCFALSEIRKSLNCSKLELALFKPQSLHTY